jgi:hypothetical protein
VAGVMDRLFAPKTKKSRQKVSDKISLLRGEGKPQKQSVAIAHSLFRRRKL